MKHHLFVSLLFIGLLSCNETGEAPRMAAVAENYLNEVLDIMEANSIHRNTIDWTDFRNRVFQKVGTAQTIDETYGGIHEALTLLGDNHSFFRKPNGDGVFGERLVRCSIESVSSVSIPETIGYVKVSGFSGSSEEGVSFADEIQDQIRSEDGPDIIGWVVDLRANTGGNMWPMLAGIGPVLGEGIAGHFVDPDDNQSNWGYKNGASIINGNSVVSVSTSYQLINENPRVAVLLDNGIASSGEAVAIAFVGRENTRSFGSPTCGLSTANRSFALSDDAQLFLTVSYMADRYLNLYGTPIIPDVEVSSEEIIDQAVAWLLQP